MKAITSVLLLALLFISRCYAASPYTATGTFTADITAGTCTVVATDSSGNETSTINIGDVYRSEVGNKTHVTPFHLKFSNCLGVSKIAVSTSKILCSGTSGTDNAFSGPHGEGGANAVGLELWMGDVDGNNQFHCNNPASDNNVINIASTPTVVAKNTTQNMSARPIIAGGRQLSDVTAGALDVTVNFTFTYE